MRHVMWAGLVCALGIRICAQASDAAAVPAEFADLYQTLDAQLAKFEARLPAQPQTHQPLFGAELLTANAHRGAELLKPAALKGIAAELDRMQALGIKAATVAVCFPLFYKPYAEKYGLEPGSDEKYAELYARIADEVRSRGMKLIVEAGAVFPAYSAFGQIKEFYATLDAERYQVANADHLRVLLAKVKPDYLSIGAEPDIGAQVTGIRIDTPVKFSQFVKATLERLKDVRGKTQIGAGVGNWQREHEAYLKELYKTKLDYIDLHIYVANAGLLGRCFEIAQSAKKAGKKIAVSEAWINKVRDRELTELDAVTDPEVFSRDTYSFWAPIDSRFLKAMAVFSRAEKLEFFSAFWSKCFYAYLDYDENTQKLTKQQKTTAHLVKTAQNIVAGKYTETGRAYQEAIKAQK